MRSHNHSRQFAPSLSFVLLAVLFVTLGLAGGSARSDVLGQAVVRAVSCLLLVIGLLLGSRPNANGARFAVTAFLAIALLPLLQLVPLPSEVWQSLPGGGLLEEAARLSGSEAAWRPLSISPGGTINAAASLLVPAAVLVFTLGIEHRERASVAGLLLAVIGISTLISLLQVSGGGFDNPLINDIPGEVSGTFANRNHFALFIAIGCLLLPFWCFQKGGRVGWRGPVTLGALILFALTILASGSRAGIALGAIAILIGMLLARKRIMAILSKFPSWAGPVTLGFMVAILATFMLISFTSDRAASINRLVSQDVDADMRSRGFQTLLVIVRDYFWTGHGFGTFDPVFRIYEPDSLLQRQYFNQAHNDYIQIVMEGGVVALLVLVVVISWWLIASIRVWRANGTSNVMLGRLGSAILLLILLASVVDYPARTPLVMAVTVIAALWLAWGDANTRQESALRSTTR